MNIGLLAVMMTTITVVGVGGVILFLQLRPVKPPTCVQVEGVMAFPSGLCETVSMEDVVGFSLVLIREHAFLISHESTLPTIMGSGGDAVGSIPSEQFSEELSQVMPRGPEATLEWLTSRQIVDLRLNLREEKAILVRTSKLSSGLYFKRGSARIFRGFAIHSTTDAKTLKAYCAPFRSKAPSSTV